jgi:hypothetical protein
VDRKNLRSIDGEGLGVAIACAGQADLSRDADARRIRYFQTKLTVVHLREGGKSGQKEKCKWLHHLDSSQVDGLTRCGKTIANRNNGLSAPRSMPAARAFDPPKTVQGRYVSFHFHFCCQYDGQVERLDILCKRRTRPGLSIPANVADSVSQAINQPGDRVAAPTSSFEACIFQTGVVALAPSAVI